MEQEDWTMDEKKEGMDRRHFLKTGIQAGGVMAFAAAAGKASAADVAETKTAPGKDISNPGKLPSRTFGRTGHELPIFGHGGSAMVAHEMKHYGLPLLPDEERIAMVRHGYDRGMRYFDTARIYGDSENIMGAALKDVRHDVFINSKVFVMSPDRVRLSVEKSLEALDTDYVDAMQIHGPVVERLGYEGCMPIYEELAKLREEGMIRFIGMSGHSRFEEMYKLIASNNFDTILIEMGYFRKGYNTRHSNENLEWRQVCLAKAAELNVAISAMKVFGASIFGHNSRNVVADFDEEARAKLPAAAIRYVLSDPRVHMLTIGISMPEDIDRNIEILMGDTTFTVEDRELLASFSLRAYDSPLVQDMNIV